MREFHAMLLASYLVDGKYSETCRRFAQVAELEANPDSVTPKSPPFPGTHFPPKIGGCSPGSTSGPKNAHESRISCGRPPG